jgi:hypothetical protein
MASGFYGLMKASPKEYLQFTWTWYEQQHITVWFKKLHYQQVSKKLLKDVLQQSIMIYFIFRYCEYFTWNIALLLFYSCGNFRV